MELDCVMYYNLYFDSLNANYNTINCYTLIDGIKTPINFTEYGTFDYHTGAKCVIFPKGKTTWGGFVPPCKFKDGDIVFSNRGSIAIIHYKEGLSPECLSFCGLFSNEFDTDVVLTPKRLATEEEKQRLFDAIKENGYKWNAETKTLEKLIVPKFKVGDRIKSKTLKLDINIITKVCENYYELDDGCTLGLDNQDCWELVPNKFDISTLKPFDKVLYRMRDGDTWCAGFYSFHKNNSHYIISNAIARQCIPYEENKHLLGTTDDCDEYYKTWKL